MMRRRGKTTPVGAGERAVARFRAGTNRDRNGLGRNGGCVNWSRGWDRRKYTTRGPGPKLRPALGDPAQLLPLTQVDASVHRVSVISAVRPARRHARNRLWGSIRPWTVIG